MKPVRQTIIDPIKGNCWSAALASILELSLDDVPNFMKDFGLTYSHDAVQLWLRNRGFALLRVNMPRILRGKRGKRKADKGRLPKRGSELRFNKLPGNIYCLAVGKSPRGEYYHVVVGEIVDGYNFKLLHDPHPGEVGLDGLPVTLDFIIPLDPAQVARKECRSRNELEFLNKSIAVWREIDRLNKKPGGYNGLDEGVELRKEERHAWERYRGELEL